MLNDCHHRSRGAVDLVGDTPNATRFMLCDRIFTHSLEGEEPNAVKGFSVETTRYGKESPPTVGVRLSHKVTQGDSHGREPVEQVSTCGFQS